MRINKIRIAARKSDLARLQAYRVAAAIQDHYKRLQTKGESTQVPEIEFQFRESLGDKNLTDPLWKLPEKGVFTEDFYRDLLEDSTDMVVHSWKDLPVEPKPETSIVATLQRADCRDVLLFKKDRVNVANRKSLRLYSSSPRRAYNLAPFLKEALPFELDELHFESVRGNIQTRVRKLLESSEVDGLILAKAALDRLLAAPEKDLQETRDFLAASLREKFTWMVMPLSVNPNAPAQGALAIEIHNTRHELKEMLQTINDAETFEAIVFERNTLAKYGGGCHQKIGVSYQSFDFGVVKSVRGLTDKGLVLNEYSLTTHQERNLGPYKEAEIFSSEEWTKSLKRQPLDFVVSSQVNSVLVTKAVGEMKSKLVGFVTWVSGWSTWKNLAKQGVWVHGSLDGLGEAQLLSEWAGQKLTWAKLTHEGSEKILAANIESVSSYRIIDKNLQVSAKDLESKKCFFWTSGSHFLRAVNACTSILSAEHCCGPGNTHKIISEKLGSSKKSHLHVFLNAEEWRTYVLRKI